MTMDPSNSKPRIAVFAKGVIGGGKLGYGIPLLRDLFEKLSGDFDVVLYSFSSVDESKAIQSISVRQVLINLPLQFRYLLLSLRFVIDQVLTPCDIIFAISISPAGHWALRLGRIFRRDVVIQLIGPEAASLPKCNGGDLDQPRLKEITLKACAQATRLVVLGSFQKRIAKECLPFDREIDIVPRRIDPSKFHFKKRPLTFPVQFIHVAYYSKLKDQDTMFRSFAEISKSVDCHLTVIGGGYDTIEVNAMINSLQIGDRITFIGQIDHSEIPKHFDNKHILIHPSHFEGASAVVQEAMASGVVVCGTPVGILADIGEDFAFIFQAGNNADLTEKIFEMINNPQLVDKKANNAHTYINTYGSEWSYRCNRDYFYKLLKTESAAQATQE
jgi:glycosyltransferase involved in cell wall biosynthesis